MMALWRPGRVAVAALALALAAGGDARPAAAHSEPVVARVTVQPAEPAPREEVRVTVLLTGERSGMPLLGAEVTVAGDMPAHKMAPVKAALLRGATRNEHVGSLSFTMTGSWEVTVNVLHQGERDEASFDMEVKPSTSQRDPGPATRSFALKFTAGSSSYPGVVLIGSILVMVVTVEAAWFNKKSREARRRRGRPAGVEPGPTVRP